MAKMRKPQRDEFDEIFNLIDRVFQYEKAGYNPTSVEEDGRIVTDILPRLKHRQAI